MLKRKESQGMPVNVIIIAALALIVLFVLATLFTGRIKVLSKDLESCAAKQGQCEKGISCPDNKALVTNAKCPETEQDKSEGKNICCIQVTPKQ